MSLTTKPEVIEAVAAAIYGQDCNLPHTVDAFNFNCGEDSKATYIDSAQAAITAYLAATKPPQPPFETDNHKLIEDM